MLNLTTKDVTAGFQLPLRDEFIPKIDDYKAAPLGVIFQKITNNKINVIGKYRLKHNQ